MTPEWWERLHQLFESAVELAPEQRGPLLDQACADDPQLRREVERMLARHDGAGLADEEPPAMPWPAPAPAERRTLPPGSRLGPYEISGVLGSGGMGEVYRGRDLRLQRDVAIKVLPAAAAATAEYLRRFEQEARAASALNHPNIVAAYDVGAQDGMRYLVTELLEGQTLSARLSKEGPLPVRKALEYAVQAARGLAAAHEQGIVHRDLKPANLFLTADGQVKILDFGLAKLEDGGIHGGTEPLTTPGYVMGTAGYMSPEQVRGEAVDFRSDQFALGCVIYQMLTGQSPFRRAAAAQTLAAVLDEDPAPLERYDHRIPRTLVWTVERCLSKDPAERYAATRDLARDLELILARHTRMAAEPLAVAPPRRASGLWWPAAALLLLLLAASVGMLSWRRPPPPVATSFRYLTHSGRDGSPAAAPDGRVVAFSSDRDGRRRIWLKHLASGNEAPLTQGPDDSPRFSPDGATVLFSREAGGRTALFRVATVGGEARKVVDDALYGDFSPDGRRICFVRQVAEAGGIASVLGTAGVDGSQVRELARVPGRALACPRWSPDGRTVAATETPLQAGQPTALVLADAERGTLEALDAAGAGIWPGGLAWAGAGRLLSAQADAVAGIQTGSGSRIVLHDLRSGEARTLLGTPLAATVMDVAGAGRLVFETRARRQNLSEIALLPGSGDGRARWITRGNSTDRQPVYSPDGQWVVFSSNRSGNLDLWAVSRRSGEVRRLTDHAAQDWDPAFTPEGRLLWASNRSGNFEVWLAEADGTGARQLSRDGVDAENPVATPDGRWVIYASANPRTRGLMRMRPDGSEAALLVAGNLILPEVSPDGRHVACVADLGTERASLLVVRVHDGSPAGFRVRLAPWTRGGSIDLGRSRWLPDGRRLAFIGRDERGNHVVYAQEFAPGLDTSATRRALAGLGRDSAAESFAVSPDGTALTVAWSEQHHDLMLAEGVPGLEGGGR